jgi:hypothetical protein
VKGIDVAVERMDTVCVLSHQPDITCTSIKQQVMRQAGNRFLDPILFPDLTFSTRNLYTATLGIPITTKDRPWAEGTGGFYLSTGGDNKDDSKVHEDVVVLGTSGWTTTSLSESRMRSGMRFDMKGRIQAEV